MIFNVFFTQDIAPIRYQVGILSRCFKIHKFDFWLHVSSLLITFILCISNQSTKYYEEVKLNKNE